MPGSIFSPLFNIFIVGLACQLMALFPNYLLPHSIFYTLFNNMEFNNKIIFNKIIIKS